MEDFSALVGVIYDASIDPDLWPFVLKQMCAFLGIAQCTLLTEDALNPSDSVFYQSCVDPEWTGAYVRTYLLVNPMRLATVARCVAGDVILTSDFITPQEYHATPFYKEWLSRRGLVDISVAVLDKTATRITVLSAKRSVAQGMGDEELRRKLRLLAPHVQRSIAIGRLFEQKKLEVQGLSETLDRLAAPVFLVDNHNMVVHANEQAQRLVSSGDQVRVIDGRLAVRDREADVALRGELVLAAQNDEPSSESCRPIPIPAAASAGLVAMVMPLGGGARGAIADRRRATAAVCFKEARFETPQTVDALGPLHKLTRRETAVLMASVEIGGVPEVARVLGMSEHTVRSHLKTIYRKTGTAGRAELVKLVAAIVPPFRDRTIEPDPKPTG